MLTELAHKAIYRYDRLDDLTEEEISNVIPGGIQNHRYNTGTDDLIATNANIESEYLTSRDFTPMDANSVPLITLNGESTITLEVIHQKYIEEGATSNQNSTVSIDSSNVDSNTTGTYTVYYTATNKLGGSNSLTRTVIYEDTTAPVIKLVGGTVIHERFDEYSDPGANADTGETITSVSNVDANTPGTYYVTYSATDDSGNTGTGVRKVIVRDRTGPVITLVGVNPYEIGSGKPYVEPGATADGGETVTLDTSELDSNTIGTYTVYYNATDDVGNKTTVSRTVIVVDGCPEILNLENVVTHVGDYDNRIGQQRKIALSNSGTIMAIASTRQNYVRVYQYSVEEDTWTMLGDTIKKNTGYNDGFSDETNFGQVIQLSADGKRLLVLSSRGSDQHTIARVYRYAAGSDSWGKKGNTIDYYHGGRTLVSHHGFMTDDSSYVYIIDQNIQTKPIEYEYVSTDSEYRSLGPWEEGRLIEHIFTSGNDPWLFKSYGNIAADMWYPSFGYSGNMTLNPPAGQENGLSVWMPDDDRVYTEFQIPNQDGNGFGRNFDFTDDMRRVAVSVYGTNNKGAVHILEFGYGVENSWSNSLVQTIEGEADGDYFGGDQYGGDVSISGDGAFLVVSSMYNNSDTGKIYTYKFDESTYSYSLFTTHTPPADTTRFGMSLTAARDGRSFATGTRFDSSGTDNGMVQLFRGNCDDVIAPVITLTGNNP
jgi:hypothetical protein